MFANIFRAQARLALTSCRARATALPISRVVARFPSVPTVSPTLRAALSTSRPVWGVPTQGNTETNTLYIGNLPYNITEEDIKAKFEPFGAIQAIRIGYEPNGRTRGFAHVEYVDVHDAISAMESVKEEPIFLLDRDLRVDFATVRGSQPTMSLYFHGFTGTIDDMRDITSDYERSIRDIYLLKNRETGRETGAGFIHFTSLDQAAQALEQLNGRTFGEDVLRVRFASPKRERRGRRQDDRDSY